MFEIRVDLVLEGLAVDGGAPAARGRGVPALDHEVLDDPVELGPVVVASPGELGKVPARHRSVLPVELHFEFAHPVFLEEEKIKFYDYNYVQRDLSCDANIEPGI